MGIFHHKHLISLADFSADDYKLVFDTTKTIQMKLRGEWPHKPLEGKILALLFEKRSTRTRASFFAAMTHLGGITTEYTDSMLHSGIGHESVKDTARAIGLYVDGIVIRAYDQSKVEVFSKYSGVPVINGLTDESHPCQILADLLTLKEVFKDISNLKITYLGRPNNITNTLIQSCRTLGFELTIGFPENLHKNYINSKFLSTLETHSQKMSDKRGGIYIEHDPEKAVLNADAVYTDTWFNTGEIFKDNERIELLNNMRPFQVNKDLLKKSNRHTKFMHCLPAERGNEVTDDVIDDEEISLVWKQANNRLQVQRAILKLLL